MQSTNQFQSVELQLNEICEYINKMLLIKVSIDLHFHIIMHKSLNRKKTNIFR